MGLATPGMMLKIHGTFMCAVPKWEDRNIARSPQKKLPFCQCIKVCLCIFVYIMFKHVGIPTSHQCHSKFISIIQFPSSSILVFPTLRTLGSSNVSAEWLLLHMSRPLAIDQCHQLCHGVSSAAGGSTIMKL